MLRQHATSAKLPEGRSLFEGLGIAPSPSGKIRNGAGLIAGKMHAMGLQKYRADKAGEPCANGARPWYSEWMGGQSLAKIEACPIDGYPHIAPRMAYITGEADTWFSIPAAIKYKGRSVRGYIASQDCREGEGWGYVFHPLDSDKERLGARPVAC